jgi:acetyl-CoA C-acetyltransferase
MRKLNRGVAVVGTGMSQFGSFPEKTTRDLFVEAFQDMRASVDRGLDPNDIEAIYIGNYSSDLFEGQGHTAPIMADWVGLAPRPATRVEDACASGGVALRQGILAVASGLYDVVLVGGIEKMSNLPISGVTDALATAGDVSFEIPAGFTFPGFYAAMATAYMHRYGASADALLRVGIKNHDNGKLNPKAQFQARIADLMAGRIARAQQKGLPVPGWQNGDGLPPRRRGQPAHRLAAAAVRLLARHRRRGGRPAGQRGDRPPLQRRPALRRRHGPGQRHLRPARPAGADRAARRRGAARQAYEMAGVTAADIKIAEVHDCFTIAEIIATEDLGFFAPGTGHEAAEEGLTSRQGPKPVNTSGGLKSKGHPVGASGAAQVVEVWKQMRGAAGERQVDRDVDLALTHNVGGTGQTCVVHVYERR